MPLHMYSHSKVQQSTLPHHPLCTMAIRSFAAFHREKSSSPLPSILADWPQKQGPNYTHICCGRPDWHFLCWCANGRNPAEFGYQNCSPIWKTVLQEFSFKAKSNPKAGFWRKPVEDLKLITLQCHVESSSLKEVSNTEGTCPMARDKDGCQKKPWNDQQFPTVVWWYFTCNVGC